MKLWLREREAVVLYDVVRLMGDAELDAALEAVADRLRHELHLVAVGVEHVSETGDPGPDRRPATRRW